MKERAKQITALDHDRLKTLILKTRRAGEAVAAPVNELTAHLVRARMVASSAVPRDVVTMNSKVRLLDLDAGDELVCAVVFPQEADPAGGRISVLTPFGVALLGHCVGETFECKTPSRTRRFAVRKVLYQPEAAGHYHL